ncbi:MAG TPA: outer membrane protein assembly factor BamD [Bryobacteraceae bacterium]|nr:outer membrane protein assembly factor BamD [Bryobacteraceae bacterium]
MTRLSKYLTFGLVAAALLTAACGFHRKKYDNPISKDTQQPDKVLFDKAVHDIEHGHFEVARLTLNTLINTYDSSEYLAKAKLAIADSWYREGGLHGLAEAEANYKDFILFYPTMEEAAESQKKICDIHFRQMDKSDRDPNNALRAEQECKTLLTQFPNSKYIPQTEQELREIQEVLADSEFRVGEMYRKKGANPAADNRLGPLVDQYPLYSLADLSLWDDADSLSKMGPRFRTKEAETLSKLVREYPLSKYADMARKKLQSLEMPVPEADPAAVAREKYEQENRSKPGVFHGVLEPFKGSPDTAMAAKAGSPTMTNPKQTIPATVPVTAAAQTGVTDVTAAPVTDPTALERLPDARATPVGATPLSKEGESSTTPALTPAPAAKPTTGATAAPASSQPATPDSSSAKKKNDKKSKRKNDKNTKSDSTRSDSTKPSGNQ